MKGAASPDGREKRRTVTNGRRPDGDTRAQVIFTFAVNFTQILMPQFATGCLPESRPQIATAGLTLQQVAPALMKTLQAETGRSAARLLSRAVAGRQNPARPSNRPASTRAGAVRS